MCDNCVCPKCSSKGLEENDDFCCNKCLAGDIWVAFDSTLIGALSENMPRSIWEY